MSISFILNLPFLLALPSAPGRERETHAEGATTASQEGAEGHDAVAELIAEGILDLPRTTWS